LGIGLTHIKFIDDGSSDGTFEILSRLARQEKRVSVLRVSNTQFRQADLMSEAVNELIHHGFSLILPFDADEFWNVSGPALESRYSSYREITFSGRWNNFVKRVSTTKVRPFYLWDVKYRAPYLDDANQESVTAFRRPFVCSTATKIGFKASKPVRVSQGQHSLEAASLEHDTHSYEIFHLPFRNRNEINKRALDYEPRRAPLRPNPSTSWQSFFHRQAVLAGRIDDIWRANSADRNGFLNCNGERVPLIRDRRLQRMMLKGYAYVALRYRVFCS
jgi:hypothetical protein